MRILAGRWLRNSIETAFFLIVFEIEGKKKNYQIFGVDHNKFDNIRCSFK